MALIFLEVVTIFPISSFELHVQQVRLPWLLLMTDGPNSPNLNPLDYQV